MFSKTINIFEIFSNVCIEISIHSVLEILQECFMNWQEYFNYVFDIFLTFPNMWQDERIFMNQHKCLMMFLWHIQNMLKCSKNVIKLFTFWWCSSTIYILWHFQNLVFKWCFYHIEFFVLLRTLPPQCLQDITHVSYHAWPVMVPV